jgi:hypothetical protein
VNKLDIEEFKHRKIQIEIHDIDDGVRLHFVGDIDPENSFSPLNTFFDHFHEKAIKSDIEQVEVDFRDLIFINSSGFRTFIKWIMRITQLPEEKKYKLKIIYSKEKKWMERGLNVLMYLAPGLVNLEKK